MFNTTGMISEIEILHDVNLVSICARIFLSVLIGGVLGLERGRKRHPAGFRTYILVCLGSTLVMMTNQYIYQVFHAGDIGRLGAQVVSGIGFLGAGTIIITGRNQVRGLTTAAGLWAAACLGLAIGIGFYEGAIIGGITIFFVMSILHGLDDAMRSRSTILQLYLEFENSMGLSSFINLAKENHIEVSDVQIIKNKTAGKKTTSVLLTAHTRENRPHAEILRILGGAESLNSIQEIN